MWLPIVSAGSPRPGAHGLRGRLGLGGQASWVGLTTRGTTLSSCLGRWGRAGPAAAGSLVLPLCEWKGGGGGRGVPGWEPRGVFCNHNMISCAEQWSRQGEAGRGPAPAAPASLLLWLPQGLLWNPLGAPWCHALGCEWHLALGRGLPGAGRRLGHQAAMLWGQLGTAGPGRKRAAIRPEAARAGVLAPKAETLQPGGAGGRPGILMPRPRSPRVGLPTSPALAASGSRPGEAEPVGRLFLQAGHRPAEWGPGPEGPGRSRGLSFSALLSLGAKQLPPPRPPQCPGSFPVTQVLRPEPFITPIPGCLVLSGERGRGSPPPALGVRPRPGGGRCRQTGPAWRGGGEQPPFFLWTLALWVVRIRLGDECAGGGMVVAGQQPGAWVPCPLQGPPRAASLMSRPEEKDAELDRRIVALRKKNQALLRRYQEIQEDRRQAEQGGMAVTTPGLLQPDSLTVTISQVPGEKRVVSRNWARSPLRPDAAGEMLEDEDVGGCVGTFFLGERVDLAVTMENRAKAKRIVSEKPTRARAPGADGSPGKGGGQSPPTQLAVGSNSVQKAAGEARGPAPPRPLRAPPEVGWDYAQWKQEREQVDQARVARHRDAQGYRTAASLGKRAR
ncbi:collagen alpha-1(I) chain isoform X2 [Oryctolagus cuniculus]|uniref:collagen alpha-1(I) chain isoform X2 n=1 Tax=Oryctolagus cuniculus TaxID=9986 RepID=UPI00387A5523